MAASKAQSFQSCKFVIEDLNKYVMMDIQVISMKNTSLIHNKN